MEVDIERRHLLHDFPLPERILLSSRGQMASGSEREPFAESTLRGPGLELYRVRPMGRPASHSPRATPTAAHEVEYEGSRFPRETGFVMKQRVRSGRVLVEGPLYGLCRVRHLFRDEPGASRLGGRGSSPGGVNDCFGTLDLAS